MDLLLIMGFLCVMEFYFSKSYFITNSKIIARLATVQLKIFSLGVTKSILFFFRSGKVIRRKVYDTHAKRSDTFKMIRFLRRIKKRP